jgi:hypothetical protein
MKYLRSLEYWGRGFESQLRHGCLHLFCAYVIVYGDTLRIGRPSRDSYQLSVMMMIQDQECHLLGCYAVWLL